MLSLTSTGNVGRTLLQPENAEDLAKILRIDKSVIEGLGLVFIALSCGYTVDPVMFGALVDEVDELWIKHVPWHPGVPSVHLNISHVSGMVNFTHTCNCKCILRKKSIDFTKKQISLR